MQDIRTILRLTHEQGLSVREVGLRRKLSKTTVATYLLRAREASCPFLPAIAHLKMSTIDGGHLAVTPSRHQSGETRRILIARETIVICFRPTDVISKVNGFVWMDLAGSLVQARFALRG